MLLVFLTCLLFACSETGADKNASPPADLIPRDKLVSVIKDVHLLEAAISIRRTPGAVKNSVGDYDIFKKHNVTREQYDKSIAWYSLHLEQFRDIYNEVFDQLKNEQALRYKTSGAKPAPAATGSKPPQTHSLPGMNKPPAK